MKYIFALALFGAVGCEGCDGCGDPSESDAGLVADAGDEDAGSEDAGSDEDGGAQ